MPEPRLVRLDRSIRVGPVMIRVFCASVLPAMAAGCQTTATPSGGNGAGDGADQPPVGEPPTARAGGSPAGFVFPGDGIALTASGSDPDQTEGDPDPVFRWVQVSGTPVELAGADADTATFAVPENPVPGETLGFEVRVTDADGNAVTDSVFVFIPRGEAVLLALASGPADPVAAGQEVTLSSSASLNIPEDSAGYAWKQISGPSVELQGADTPTATFVAPAPGDDETKLLFLLTLTNSGEGAEDVVIVTVAPGLGGPDAPAEPEPSGGDPSAGQTAYADHGCAACHGDDASGGSAPALRGGDRTAAMEERFLPEGTLHLGVSLTEDEVRDLTSWFSTLEP